LSEALREAQSQNKDLSRQVQELMTVRVQLQNERDGLSAELSETKDALKDALARLEAANAALTQLRSDMEHRLREKDDEIENIRLVTVRLIVSSLLQVLLWWRLPLCVSAQKRKTIRWKTLESRKASCKNVCDYRSIYPHSFRSQHVLKSYVQYVNWPPSQPVSQHLLVVKALDECGIDFYFRLWQ